MKRILILFFGLLAACSAFAQGPYKWIDLDAFNLSTYRNGRMWHYNNHIYARLNGVTVQIDQPVGAYWPLSGSASLTGDVGIDGGNLYSVDIFNTKQFNVVADHPTDSEFNLTSTDGTDVGSIQLTPGSASIIAGNIGSETEISMSSTDIKLVGATEDATVPKILGLTASDELRWIDPDDLTSSLTSTYVGYGDGSNNIIGEPQFTYSGQILRTPELRLGSSTYVGSTNRLIGVEGTNTNIGIALDPKGSGEIVAMGDILRVKAEQGGATILILETDRSDANARSWGLYTNQNAEGDFIIRQSAVNNADPAIDRLRITPAGVVQISTTPSTDNTATPLAIDGSGNVVKNTNVISSGTYTPTTSSLTNISSITVSDCQYMRVGSVVTVSGRISSITTSGSGPTRFELTIPIASSFSADENAGGVAAGNDGVVGTFAIKALSSTVRFSTNVSAGGTFNAGVPFTFTYQII